MAGDKVDYRKTHGQRHDKITDYTWAITAQKQIVPVNDPNPNPPTFPYQLVDPEDDGPSLRNI
jgi:hypothetical protein